jgi:hypothetical protein
MSRDERPQTGGGIFRACRCAKSQVARVCTASVKSMTFLRGAFVRTLPQDAAEADGSKANPVGMFITLEPL